MTAGLLHGRYMSIMQANSEGTFRSEMVKFAGQLGFQFVSAMTVVDYSLTHSDFINVDNVPNGYSDFKLDTRAYRRDPVMQHCKRDTVPIVWDQKTYVSRGASDLWEEQARFGYHTGIAMALHFPEGRHFVLGVDRDQPLPAKPDRLTRLVADLQLFAVHAQEAAMRLFVPAPMQSERPALTPRELEALRWTMEGKTAWEVGTILGISERTAVLHLQNSMHKLKCINKHQAVLKALRLGLIR